MSYVKISFKKYDRLLDKSGKYLIINTNGTKSYYKDGKRHRKGGPAKIDRYGYKVYYLNGKVHRTKGPAIIGPNGYEEYFKNGKRHHVDSPYSVDRSGVKYYYFKGKKYSREELVKRLTRSELKRFVLNPDNF